MIGKWTGRLLICLLLVSVLIQVIRFVQPRMSSQDGMEVMVDLEGMPILGEKDVQIVLIEFSDYQCSFCARHALEVFGELKHQFVSTGRMRYAFANNPVFPNATLFAAVAICAGKQGYYWQMHDLLFQLQPQTRDELFALTQNLEIDSGSFDRCIESGEAIQQIKRDQQQAQELGLSGTPSFAIGYERVPGEVEIQQLVVGAEPFSTFEGAIRNMDKGPY